MCVGVIEDSILMKLHRHGGSVVQRYWTLAVRCSKGTISSYPSLPSFSRERRPLQYPPSTFYEL